jgi:glucokinase
MPRLIADVGGTNARFALAEAAADDLSRTVTAERHLRVRDYPGLPEAARAYLAELPGEPPELDEAVIAVATPVDAPVIRFTNNPWSFTRDELQAALRVDRLAVINDFVAQAVAVPHLGTADRVPIGGGAALEGWPIAVIGPGTGLGAAGLVPTADGPVVVASEAGHVSFAPHDELEVEILRRLIGQFGHVSNERVISGPGLVTLARAMAEISGRSFAGSRPEDVTAAAADGSSEVASDALRVFSGLFGAAAGDLALAFGAKGGVYVCGGLCGKLGRHFDHVRFRERFEAKGRLAAFLADVPCYQVTHPQTGLLGAAVYPFGATARPPGG